MRLRNRRALQDKTPRNSPHPAKRRSPASKDLTSKRIPSPKFTKPHLPTPTEDADETRGTPKPAAARGLEQLERELSLSPSAAASARKARRPMHSTPLVAPRRKVAQSGPTRANVPPAPRPERASSPLPPSSPPSDFEFRRKRISAVPAIPRVEEEVDAERSPLKLQVYRDPEPVEEAPAPEVQKQPSSDDPFGFLAVERKLKAQRAARKHPHRVPALAPAFEVLARDSSEERVVPLRSDDDDLYLDVDTEAEAEADKENIPLPVHSDASLQKVEADAEEGEAEDEVKENDFDYVLSSEIHPRYADDEEKDRHPNHEDWQEWPTARQARSPTEDSYDPTRTPHAAHVSKDIYPIRSPFSSRSTPCDRELTIDSSPSSPSPTKPLQFTTPLHPSARPAKRLSEMFGQSQEKHKGKRPAIQIPEHSSSAKKSKVVTGLLANDNDEPASAAVDLESSLRRPVRRSARNHAPIASPSTAAPINARRAAVKRAIPVDNHRSEEDPGNESEDAAEEEEESVKRKGRGKGKGTLRAVKPDVHPPTARRGRKPASRKPHLSRKAKGKRKIGEVEAEDEEVIKARQARLEYFKKLDSDYSLAKENVYVI